METKEVITQQLSRITTDVIFSFCEEELEVSFNKQEKEEISQVLQTYFLEHPFC
ncbi:MAG: hypothetical protein LBH96_05290 [Candidatus Peribacteria bacterium]|jgi:hypothetical protein|nr:hypothetical protein [Candidatus Peribacteria bacterium]